jgi:hypothetical protein
MPNTPDNEYISLLAEAYFREYSTLREEQIKREELASQIQTYTIVAFGGLIPLIQYVESVSTKGGDANVLFLLASVLFCALGWYQLDLDDRKAEIDNYILQELTPRLEAILPKRNSPKRKGAVSHRIFDWQLHWRTKRYGNFSGFWLGLGVVGRTGVAIFSAFGLLSYYIYSAHFLSSSQWTFTSVILTMISSFGVLWMVITTAIIRNKFASVTKKFLLSRDTSAKVKSG